MRRAATWTAAAVLLFPTLLAHPSLAARPLPAVSAFARESFLLSGSAAGVPAVRPAPSWSVLEEPRQTGLPSPTTARNFSLGFTVLPVVAGGACLAGGQEGFASALIVGGLSIGPAAGWWYADRNGRGWAGVGTRGLILLCTVSALLPLNMPSMNTGLSDDSRRSARDFSSGAIAGVGASLYVLQIVHEIGSVKRTLERENAARAARRP